MKIYNGEIIPVRVERTGHGEEVPIYLATPREGEAIECWTFGLAEFYLWAINERIESRIFRTGK